MSTQSTKPRPGLVPKMIVDVNGVPKTVWVRPEDLNSKSDEKLRNLKPVINQRFEEGLKHLKTGERLGSLRHTSEEKRKSSERGYGTDNLRSAAERKFERDFGVPMSEAPPVELSDDELYDYLSRGVTVEQAHEFARFDLGPESAHPKIDPEYAFVSDPKVAHIDLKNQEESDSPVRRGELDDIRKTARSLQNGGVDPYVAAQCISNGLRMEHINDKTKDFKDMVEVSAEHNVESDKFKSIHPSPEDHRGIREKAKAWGDKMRHKAWMGTKRYVTRTRRRIMRRIGRKMRRRISRILKTIFLPWKTRG